LPETFSSPLLLYFLLEGKLGIRSRHDLASKELAIAITNFDGNYTGVIREIISDNISESEKRKALNDFIEDYIYYPREAFLLEMKKGFDLVRLFAHLLTFTHRDIIQYFVGREAVTPKEVLSFNNIL
jgi:hypothetical protein